METEKLRRLLLALEGLAIATALVLVLVDYKLKNDLVDLFKKLEATIDEGKRYFGESFGAAVDIGAIRSGDLVGTATSMEKTANASPAASTRQNGKRPAAKRTSADRGRGIGSAPVPGPDNTVGS